MWAAVKTKPLTAKNLEFLTCYYQIPISMKNIKCQVTVTDDKN